MRIIGTLLAGALLASSAAQAMPRQADIERGEAKLAKALEGRVAGKPVDCISLRSVQSSEVIDGTAILYRVGSRVYVNRPRAGQESLDDDDILVTKTYSTQLCSIDTVQLIDRFSHIYEGFVSLGEFVPYARVADAR